MFITVTRYQFVRNFNPSKSQVALYSESEIVNLPFKNHNDLNGSVNNVGFKRVKVDLKDCQNELKRIDRQNVDPVISSELSVIEWI